MRPQTRAATLIIHLAIALDARKWRKEKREHAHSGRRAGKVSCSQAAQGRAQAHKERHHSDKVTSPRHKERHLTDKVASPRHKHQTHQVSPRSIDKEAKSPRSVMTDTKSGMFCPQKSRLVQESEALAERRLAAAKHCAEQREAASTYQAVVAVAPPVNSVVEARGCLGKPASARCRGSPNPGPWARRRARGVAAPAAAAPLSLSVDVGTGNPSVNTTYTFAVAHHGPTIALGSQLAHGTFAAAGCLVSPRSPNSPHRSVRPA